MRRAGALPPLGGTSELASFDRRSRPVPRSELQWYHMSRRAEQHANSYKQARHLQPRNQSLHSTIKPRLVCTGFLDVGLQIATDNPQPRKDEVWFANVAPVDSSSRFIAWALCRSLLFVHRRVIWNPRFGYGYGFVWYR